MPASSFSARSFSALRLLPPPTFLLCPDQTSAISNWPRLHKSDSSFFLLMLVVQMVGLMAGHVDGYGGNGVSG
jgi:hypothetical protein